MNFMFMTTHPVKPEMTMVKAHLKLTVGFGTLSACIGVMHLRVDNHPRKHILDCCSNVMAVLVALF